MEDSKVTIITPVYNAAKYITATLDSVIKQTYENWQMFLIDDCSSDHSVEIINRYVEQDGRFHLISLPKNMGAAASRNAGLDAVDTKYIAFLDSDDIWLPDKLQMQLDFMKDSGNAFTYTDYSFIDENGNITKDLIKGDNYIDRRRLLTGSPIMCSSVMMDIEKIGDFHMVDMRSGQDYATWAMLMRTRGLKAYNIGTVLAHYRKLKNSLSSNKLKKFKLVWQINRKYENLSLPASLAYIFIYSVKWLKKHFTGR